MSEDRKHRRLWEASHLVPPQHPVWVSCFSQPLPEGQPWQREPTWARPPRELRMGRETFPNLKEKGFKGAFQIILGIPGLLCLISCEWITATRINLSLGRKTNYKRFHTGFLLRWRGGKTKKRRKETMLAGPVFSEPGPLGPPLL